MPNGSSSTDIDFTIDRQNLYREESITDMKVASIRKMVPVKADGTDDESRQTIFIGNSQLMTQEGPLPLQAKLSAATLEEAMDEFPQAMKKSLDEAVEYLRQMQRQQQQESSRIITPR